MLFLLRKEKHKLCLKLLFLHYVLCSDLPLEWRNIFTAHLRLTNCTPPTFVSNSDFWPCCWYFEHKILFGHLRWGFPFFINYNMTASYWKFYLLRNCHMTNVFVELKHVHNWGLWSSKKKKYRELGFALVLRIIFIRLFMFTIRKLKGAVP